MAESSQRKQPKRFVPDFLEGGSGTWESTGSWLRKTAREYPELNGLWFEMASHRLATKRLRVAAFIRDCPEELARTLLPALLKDSSAKVRSKVAGDQYDTNWSWVLPLLQERRAIEVDVRVVDSLDFAIDTISGSA